MKKQEVAHWLSLPSFIRHVDQLTLKSGSAEKPARIRGQKRVYDEIYQELLKRIGDGGLENVPFALLSDLLLKHGDRLDKLADKKEETDVNKKDLTVLILHHVQSTNQKNYNKIEDFLDDPEFKFPTIEVEAQDV